MEQKELLDTLELIQISHSRLMNVYNSGVCSKNLEQLVNLIESINNLNIAKNTLEKNLISTNNTSETPEM